MDKWDLFFFIGGVVIGYITNIIVSKKFRKKDIKIEAWNYVFERAHRFVKVKRKLNEALKTNELEKFEELLELIVEKYDYNYRKEFKMISKNQNEVLQRIGIIIAEFSGNLSYYISNVKFKKYEPKMYSCNKEKIDSIIENSITEMEKTYDELPDYPDLLLDNRYYK